MKQSLPVFDQLYAEHEISWLSGAFVPADILPRIANMRSIIVSGERGSGKSTLAHVLTHRISENISQTVWSTRWQLGYIRFDKNIHSSRHQLMQIFYEFALTLFKQMGLAPELYKQSPSWVQDLLHWFLHQYGPANIDFTLGRLKSEVTDVGYGLLNHLMTNVPPKIYHEHVSEQQIIADLMSALQSIGVDGFWIIVDGLESWLEIDRSQLEQALEILLSTLSLFEIPGFALKIFVPGELAQLVLQSGGVYRRRLDVAKLEWREEQLIQIVEKRLALGVGCTSFKIDDLAEGVLIQKHLIEYGGQVPRGWLEMTRPFYDYFIINHKQVPLSAKEIWHIFEQDPPRLRISSRNLQVYLGYHHLDQLPPQPIKVLEYLYNHTDYYCSREELYYCALHGYKEVAQPGDENYVDVEIWKSSFENIIYQLRKRIEPISTKSIYIETRRGQGYRLHHVW